MTEQDRLLINLFYLLKRIDTADGDRTRRADYVTSLPLAADGGLHYIIRDSP